jgi:predicted Ser/Thr protein kinase
MDLEGYLERLRSGVKGSFQRSSQVLAFRGFLEEFAENPARHLRTAPQYILEMFDHFGTRVTQRVGQESERFRLFDLEADPTGEALVGQEKVQNEIYRNIASFAARGKADKMLLLHGPNGSGKTTLIENIMRGLEAFSHLPEGTLLSFNWVFTEREGKLDRIGFESATADVDSLESFAFLGEKDVSAKMSCELRDPPLFLLSREERTELIEECLRRRPVARYPNLNYQYFLTGELCHKCRKIYDALLVAYQGDLEKVLRHVQVERYYISKRYRVGAVSIEPQGNIDAAVQPVHAGQPLSLPSSLRHVFLYQFVGDIIDANHGVLEYSDFLKRPLEVNKYLLTTCERGTVNLSHCMAYLDLVILGTANEKQLSLFKRSPDFSSFKGRIELISVPYMLRYSKEVELYQRQIHSHARERHVTPHAAEIAALWAVLTRLRKPRPEQYREPLRSAVADLTPLEKARLYDSGEVPDHASEEEKKALRAGVLQIRREFDEDEGEFEGIFGAEYEGRRGVSAREMLTVLSRAAEAKTYRCLTPMAFFDAIGELLKDVSLYDFLRIPSEDGYHDVRSLLQMVRREYLRWVTQEVYASISLVDVSEYDRVFLEYFRHVKAHHTREQVYNSGKNCYEAPNLELMGSIERLLSLSEPPDEFRSNVMTRIAVWSLDHPQKRIDYHALFPEIYKAMRENFYRERNRLLTLIEKDILKYGTDEFSLLKPSEQEKVVESLEAMRRDYGYCQHCARDVIAYVLRSRVELENEDD